MKREERGRNETSTWSTLVESVTINCTICALRLLKVYLNYSLHSVVHGLFITPQFLYTRTLNLSSARELAAESLRLSQAYLKGD